MKKSIIFLALITPLLITGQDLHFSQIIESTFLTNPSLLSFQEDKFKVVLQKRSQWQSVADPYNTVTISFECKNIFPKNSVGVQFLNDVAGEANFKTVGPSISYSKLIKYNSDVLFAVGLNAGFFQRSITYDQLIFNQTETFNNLSFWFSDINFGVSNKYFVNNNVSITNGVSFYHLNKPKQSLIEDAKIKLLPKTNFHISADYSFKKDWLISSKAFFSKQNKDQEFLFGKEIKKVISSDRKNMFGAGLYYRLNDAIICSFNAEIKHIKFIMSQDINVSSLKEASNYNGAIEFLISYSWNRKKKIKKRIINTPTACPKYL